MSTRSKKKQTTSDSKESLTLKRVENSWILFVKESLLDNIDFQIITLPHPANSNPTKYCLDKLNHKIYEVVTFSEPHRSWFVDDTVKSDGSIMMVTPINPLFLEKTITMDRKSFQYFIHSLYHRLLSVLGTTKKIAPKVVNSHSHKSYVLPRLREQCINRAVPLEDLLSEKGFDKILDFVPNLDAIADLKGPHDIRAYKYNEEKTLSWLENKIKKLAVILKDKNIHVTSGAVSTTFVSSNIINDNIDPEFYLKYAHGMMTEYLEEEIVELLEKKFNFKKDLIEYVGNKRKSEVENADINKKVKLDSIDESEIKFNFNISATEIKKQKPLTIKEKARQKAASGTKTISSFFCKK